MATGCPSLNASRPLNLNPSTPDSSSTVRKSTNSDPFKASSPSDASQKNSVSKAGAAPSSLRASFEQKENERDLNCSKPARVRSPGMPCSKGVKSFMAPTISASSKAIAASPRRRVLEESNEAVCSSLTSVSGSHESLATEEVVSKPQHTLPGAVIFSKVSFDGAGAEEIVPKCDMGFGFRENSDCTGSGKLDLEVKNPQPVIAKSCSPPPVIAPLDADPSMPPYDPETNYLAPRPRFLYYRPNPRIQHYLNKDGGLFDVGDGKQLEDSFDSESCETTTGQTEEVVSSDLQKDSEEWSSPKEVKVTGFTDGNVVSEPKLMPPKLNGRHIKSRSLMKFKFIRLLLVLVICLSVPLSDCPIISSSSMLKAPGLRFFEDLSVRNYLTASSVNLKELAWSLRRWSINSFSYYTSVASLPKEEEHRLLCLANLTTAPAIDQGLEKYEQIIESTEMEQALKKNMEEERTEGHEMERQFEVEDLETAQDSVAEYETERMEMEIPENLREDCMEFDEEKAELQEDALKKNMEEERTEGHEMERQFEVEDLETAQDSVAEYETERMEMEIPENLREDCMEFDEEKAELQEDALKKNMEEERTEGHEMERQFEVEDLETAQDSVAEYETERMEMEIAENLREDCMEFDEEKAELQEDVKDDHSVLEFEMENKFEEDATKEMEPRGHIQGIEDQKNIEVEFGLSRDLVTEPEKVESEEGGSDFGSPSKSSYPEIGNEYQILSSLKLENSSIYGSEHKPLMPLILGVFSAVVVLVASVVFFHTKQKQTPSVVTKEKLPPNKVICTSISGSSESYIHASRTLYQNSPVDVQMVGDSGPSEMSSSSFGRQWTRRAKEEENLGHERRLRRDSTVSSSSISYGSFTSYEKLSTKKGSKDEEAMTPVRRSSRIRNQITSP